MSTSEKVFLDPVTRPSGTNLIANPSIEVAVTPWDAFGTSTLTRVTNWSEVGGASLRVVVNNQNGNHGAQSSLGVDAFPVTPGEAYTSQARVNVISAPPTGVQCFYTWWDAAQAFISYSAGGTAQTGVGEKTVTETATAPVNAAYGSLLILGTGHAASSSEFKVDAVMVEEASTARAYFDGDSASTSPLTSYAWTGTPHNSASTATSTRSMVDLTCWIDNEGADWGEAAIEAVFAQRDRGQVPVDFSVPNRTVSIPLTFGQTRGGTTAMEARAAVQAKASLFQKEGGWLQRTTNAGSIVFADIVDAAFTATSVSGWESAQDIDTQTANLTLTVIPDFYADEVTLADHTETTDAELVFTETSVFGDYPARVRIVVDEDDAEDQRGLIWGFRSRHYSASNTAALAYSAEDLTVQGQGTAVAVSGAAGGTAVTATIWPIYTPLLKTALGGTAYLTHTGSYRAWARCYTNGTVATQIRMKWDVNDLVNPVTNTPFEVPAGGTAGAFYMADLGEIRLDQSPVGVHRWQGQIEAKTSAGTCTFGVDRLNFQPVDEGAGRLMAPVVAGAANLSLAAYDDFAGYVSGGTVSVVGTALIGGGWDEAGDSGDFRYAAPLNGTVSTYAYRSIAADTDLNTGQYLVLDGSSTITGCEIQADISLPDVLEQKEVRGGVIARYSDTDNWLMAVRRHYGATMNRRYTHVTLLKRLAGVVTTLGDVEAALEYQAGWYTLKMSVDTNGNVNVYTGAQGSDLSDAIISVTDTTLNAAPLNDGKVGMYDASTTVSAAFIRQYDNFQVLTGDAVDNAIIFASQSAQLTTQGHYRLDVGGTAYGPVSHIVGDLPRLPVTAEGRTTEVFIKGSRGDLESIPDSGIDDISARVYYRPSYLHVP